MNPAPYRDEDLDVLVVDRSELLAGHFCWSHERWTLHEGDPRGSIWVCEGRYSKRGEGFDNALTVRQAARLRRQLVGSHSLERFAL